MLPNNRITNFWTNRLPKSATEMSDDAPPAPVWNALFPNVIRPGFQAVPSTGAVNAPSPQTLDLYEQARAAAVAQVCARRAQRMLPTMN